MVEPNEPITKAERKKLLRSGELPPRFANAAIAEGKPFYFGALDAYEDALSAAEAEVESLQKAAALGGQLIAALNERDMFINPDMFDQAADEIDCGSSCEKIWRDFSTGASECSASDKGNYCPNDVAETLRAIGKVARAALQPEKEKERG